MSRLEHLCVQYLEACIGHRNVLAALQNAARLKLDYIKVCCVPSLGMLPRLVFVHHRAAEQHLFRKKFFATV